MESDSEKIYEESNKDFSCEFSFTAARSSGPGGQNVNKLNTKVTLEFDVNGSNILTDDEKMLINSRLANKINSKGILKINSQSERTQLANKEQCVVKFYKLIEKALKVKKKRKKGKPSKAAIQKRLDNKRIQSEKKQSRNFSPDIEKY